MTRLRTANNRRRAKGLKQGGLYTLHLLEVPVSWHDSGQLIDLDAACRAVIVRSFALPSTLVASGP